MSDLELPPVFGPIRLDPAIAALDHARTTRLNRHLDDGTLFWSDHAGRLDCVVVLEPGELATVTGGALRMTAEVALTDALGALLPPQVPVQTLRVQAGGGAVPSARLEGAIAVDGTRLGRIAILDHRPDDPCALMHFWLALGPGHASGSLADITAGMLDHRELLGALGRQLIHWIGMLEDEGEAAIEAAWRARSLEAPLAATAGTDTA